MYKFFKTSFVVVHVHDYTEQMSKSLKSILSKHIMLNKVGKMNFFFVLCEFLDTNN